MDEYGHGILCPFQRDGKGDFTNGDSLPLLRSDIGELVGIIGPTSSQPGELPWDTLRGSRLLLMKHRGMHPEMLRATAQDMAAGAIRRWEDRARPGPVYVTPDYDKNTLHVKVTYVPKGQGGSESVDFNVPQE